MWLIMERSVRKKGSIQSFGRQTEEIQFWRSDVINQSEIQTTGKYTQRRPEKLTNRRCFFSQIYQLDGIDFFDFARQQGSSVDQQIFAFIHWKDLWVYAGFKHSDWENKPGNWSLGTFPLLLILYCVPWILTTASYIC